MCDSCELHGDFPADIIDPNWRPPPPVKRLSKEEADELWREMRKRPAAFLLPLVGDYHIDDYPGREKG